MIMRLTATHLLRPRALGFAGWLRGDGVGWCYQAAGSALPWCWALALVLGLAAAVVALGVAPGDALQGEASRIVFVHVPTAWLSLLFYVLLALCAGLALVLEQRLLSMLAGAMAPTGALMAFLALWTGSLWGKPAWGSWWIWDGRLSAELLLIVLYAAFIMLRAVAAGDQTLERVNAAVAVVGAVHVPLIYYAVQWWHAQQPAPGGMRADTAGADTSVAIGTVLMSAAFVLWCLGATLHRLRSILLEQERRAPWAAALVKAPR